MGLVLGSEEVLCCCVCAVVEREVSCGGLSIFKSVECCCGMSDLVRRGFSMNGLFKEREMDGLDRCSRSPSRAF